MPDLFTEIAEAEVVVLEQKKVVKRATKVGNLGKKSQSEKGKESLETKKKATKEEKGEPGFLSVEAKAKELGGQVDWVFSQRKTEYTEQILELQKHASIQVRRKVAGGLAFIGTKNLLEKLQSWQEAESDRQTWLLLSQTMDRLNRQAEGENLEKSARVLSVSEALDLVKRVLGDKTYVVEGELAEINLYNGQMYYFVLKDKQDTRLECAVFAGKLRNLNFPLNDGLTVRLTGRFSLNKYSKLRFEPQKIELTGEGELKRNLELLRQKLALEGFFDQERKRKIPPLPQKILLLASPNSAALTDFEKVLQQRRGDLIVYYLPIKTQGVGAEFEILENLKRVNQITKEKQIDTIVLTRGGGSSDDLAVFNSERLVRAIHGLNRPIIVAIGHERDTTLCELVADLRASTPSNAAELVSLSNHQILAQTKGISDFCLHHLQQKIQAYSHYKAQIVNYAQHQLHQQIQQARSLIKQIPTLVLSCLGEIQKITRQSHYLTQKVTLEIQNQKILSMSLWENIYQNYQKNWQEMQTQTELVSTKIAFSDPNYILSQGFALVWQGDQVLEKFSQLQDGSSLELQLQDKKLPILLKTKPK